MRHIHQKGNSSLDLSAIIDREDGQDLTESDAHTIIHSFVEWCEQNGYSTFCIGRFLDAEGNPVQEHIGEEVE